MLNTRALDHYNQVASLVSGVELSQRILSSIDLYMLELINDRLDWGSRCESGINAITLLHELSQNIDSRLPENEQIILIKVFGQVIREINNYMRGKKPDLMQELAGLRLIRKLMSKT